MSNQLASHELAVFNRPQIDLFGLTEAPNDQNAILTHAIDAVRSYQEMKRSALQLCLSLYACRESFKASGAEGWSQFCKTNFEPLGLADSHIRSCVRAGRELSNIMIKLKESGRAADIQVLEQMSRSALIQLSEAPEDLRDQLVTRVVEMENANPGSTTSASITKRINDLEAELAQKDSLLASKDASLTRLSQALSVTEGSLVQRRQEMDTLQAELAKARTQAVQPVEVVESSGAEKQARQALANLEEAASRKRDEVVQLQSEFDNLKSQVDSIARDAEIKRRAAVDIDELEQRIEQLQAQWTEAYVLKIRKLDGDKYSDRYRNIANKLRVLADQIDPSLV